MARKSMFVRASFLHDEIETFLSRSTDVLRVRKRVCERYFYQWWTGMKYHRETGNGSVLLRLPRSVCRLQNPTKRVRAAGLRLLHSLCSSDVRLWESVFRAIPANKNEKPFAMTHPQRMQGHDPPSPRRPPLWDWVWDLRFMCRKYFSIGI